MTTAQSFAEKCYELLSQGKLNAWEQEFVESIKERYGSNKHALKNLTSAQFKKLREIARRYD